VFFQNLVYEVAGAKAHHDSMRLCVGYRINSTEPLHESTRRAMADHGVPLLPSGQRPPMFSQMTFRSQCLETKLSPTSKKRETYVYRFMPSLRDEAILLRAVNQAEGVTTTRPACLVLDAEPLGTTSVLWAHRDQLGITSLDL